MSAGDRQARARSGGQYGFSLVECLVVVAILGLLALMLAPVETSLLRALRYDRDAPRVSEGVEAAASALIEDVRAARHWEAGARELRVETGRGAGIVWRADPATGLERRVDEGPVVRFGGVASVTASRGVRGLVELTLVARDGTARRFSVRPRFERVER